MMEGAEKVVVVEGFEVRYLIDLIVPAELHSSHGLIPGQRWIAKLCYPLPPVMAKRETWPMRWQILLKALGAERLGSMGLELLWHQQPLNVFPGFYLSLEPGETLRVARLFRGRDGRVVWEPQLAVEEIGSNHSVVCFCPQG